MKAVPVTLARACLDCGADLTGTANRRVRCVPCASVAERERQRLWREANPDRLREMRRRTREKNAAQRREYDRQYNLAHPEKAVARARRHRQANPDSFRGALRRYRAKLKATVFDHYGWLCACCGSGSYPTIDHVFGGGTQHRTELFGPPNGGRSVQMYRWLIDNGFPGGFQTLCRRCNSSKLTGTECRISHRITGVNACTG